MVSVPVEDPPSHNHPCMEDGKSRPGSQPRGHALAFSSTCMCSPPARSLPRWSHHGGGGEALRLHVGGSIPAGVG